jgi:3-isopropylmalate/(R)-2-methylmalate dehydratase large subunit
VTSPQAFEGLRMTGRTVRAPDKTIAVPDHNVPTTAGPRAPRSDDEDSRIQVEALRQERQGFRHPLLPVNDVRQGIVHIVGPNRAGPCRA